VGFPDINAGANGFAFPYAVPNRRLRYQPTDSLHSQGPYPALSATANTFARESHIDELACVAGAEPLRFRLRHLDDQRLAAVVEAAAGRFGWPSGWQPAGRPSGLVGAGTGCGAALASPSAWRRAAGWRPVPRYAPTGPVT
jgi:isoquinoline 1-oxidoreductase